MFTGIVEAVGVVRDVEAHATTRRFWVEAPALAGELADGDSVAVDGACLTVVAREPDRFALDVIGTTLERTIAGSYRDGTAVNLERALRADSRLDGHLVQGHVDGIGQLVDCTTEGEFWLMDFRLPAAVASLTVEHGSVTINGVSLTVSESRGMDICRIGVIPYTHRHTNLGRLAIGAPVNVEGDLVGRYVQKILSQRTAP
ncbi:MAG: riboflavin synthase [Gemmatimonadales bacterium]